MGLPVETKIEKMPDGQLIAFYPHDTLNTVDLWLVATGNNNPRAYDVIMDESLKKTLREADGLIKHGQPVHFKHRKNGSGKDGKYQNKYGYDGEYTAPEYEINPDKADTMPEKSNKD
jgi:hypothetical protein